MKVRLFCGLLLLTEYRGRNLQPINVPTINYGDVLQTCVTSISSNDIRNRIEQIYTNIIEAGGNYAQLVETANLFLIPPFLGKDADIVIANVTKKELKDLYTAELVPATKPGRRFYDALRISTPLGICPFCGLGQVRTLDHYLPKAKFPILSVLPFNLVPACADCNKDKTAGIATNAGEQCLHPYFDRGHFINEQWLYAEVIESIPATIRFFVEAPTNWPVIDRQRVKSHFVDFKLAGRFAIQAADEITTLKGELQYDYPITGVEGVRHELEKKASVAESLHKNSWKTAMYQALAANDWYCNGGFFQG